MRNPTVLTALASAVRTATQNVDLASTIDPNVILGVAVTPVKPLSAISLIAYLNVTVAPGVETLILKLQEYEPVSATWVDVAGAATLAQTATGLITLRIGEGIAAVAAAVTGVTANMLIPPHWRLVVVHSAASNWTYSLAVAVDVNL